MDDMNVLLSDRLLTMKEFINQVQQVEQCPMSLLNNIFTSQDVDSNNILVIYPYYYTEPIFLDILDSDDYLEMFDKDTKSFMNEFYLLWASQIACRILPFIKNSISRDMMTMIDTVNTMGVIADKSVGSLFIFDYSSVSSLLSYQMHESIPVWLSSTNKHNMSITAKALSTMDIWRLSYDVKVKNSNTETGVDDYNILLGKCYLSTDEIKQDIDKLRYRFQHKCKLIEL